MSRSDVPVFPSIFADVRIPFPRTEETLRCRTEPKLFALEGLAGQGARQHAIRKTRLMCAACPVVRSCLKWALANPELTVAGVWGGTTPAQRRVLRERLIDHMGPDWVGVVSEAERKRRDHTASPRHKPLTAPEPYLVQLERALSEQHPPTMQECNRMRLVAVLNIQ
ncbi:WhiB family transcriptional regulator [Streptomyces sp. NPDC005728]|uniref:WhiB family transcriptional regulator n=1 Tax=Streptomyces sp. NPDC005728 TaxID=3157054 RepID=UPI0033D98C84